MSSHTHVLQAIRISSLAVAMVLAGALIACDSQPTRPTSTPSRRLRQSHPARNPGAAASAARPDRPVGGNRHRRTDRRAMCRHGKLASLPSLDTDSAGGLVSGVAVGESNVRAVFNGLRSTQRNRRRPGRHVPTVRVLSAKPITPAFQWLMRASRSTSGQGGGSRSHDRTTERFRLYGVAGDIDASSVEGWVSDAHPESGRHR